ncbi:hypothetical protein Ndes2526B_g04960 [Nannochloris sp. 'desiccata']
MERYATGAVNEALQKATGVDVLGKVNEVRYSAGNVGLHVQDPLYAVHSGVDNLVHKTFHASNGTGYKVRNTPAEKLVASVEEFIALRDRAAKTPYGGAVCLVHALLNYINPATQSLGEQLLVLAIAEDQLVKGSTYKGYALGEEMASFVAELVSDEDATIAARAAIQSLVVGTKQQESYTYDAGKVAVAEDLTSEEGEDIKDGVFTVYLRSTGRDSSRAVTVAVNKNGVWKARNFSGLSSSVEAAPITLTAADDL